MTPVEIAKILGVRQPQVSLLMRNRAGNFSVGRLMEFLTALRHDVELPCVLPARNMTHSQSGLCVTNLGEATSVKAWWLVPR